MKFKPMWYPSDTQVWFAKMWFAYTKVCEVPFFFLFPPLLIFIHCEVCMSYYVTSSNFRRLQCYSVWYRPISDIQTWWNNISFFWYQNIWSDFFIDVSLLVLKLEKQCPCVTRLHLEWSWINCVGVLCARSEQSIHHCRESLIWS